jgi:hypothetical protein
MSTKTLRKRIALVAVSALGFGLLSVVPAQAAATTVLNSSVSGTVSALPGGTSTGTFSITLAEATGNTWAAANTTITVQLLDNNMVADRCTIDANPDGTPKGAILTGESDTLFATAASTPTLAVSSGDLTVSISDTYDDATELESVTISGLTASCTSAATTGTIFVKVTAGDTEIIGAKVNSKANLVTYVDAPADGAVATHEGGTLLYAIPATVTNNSSTRMLIASDSQFPIVYEATNCTTVNVGGVGAGMALTIDGIAYDTDGEVVVLTAGAGNVAVARAVGTVIGQPGTVYAASATGGCTSVTYLGSIGSVVASAALTVDTTKVVSSIASAVTTANNDGQIELTSIVSGQIADGTPTTITITLTDGQFTSAPTVAAPAGTLTNLTPSYPNSTLTLYSAAGDATGATVHGSITPSSTLAVGGSVTVSAKVTNSKNPTVLSTSQVIDGVTITARTNKVITYGAATASIGTPFSLAASTTTATSGAVFSVTESAAATFTAGRYVAACFNDAGGDQFDLSSRGIWATVTSGDLKLVGNVTTVAASSGTANAVASTTIGDYDGTAVTYQCVYTQVYSASTTPSTIRFTAGNAAGTGADTVGAYIKTGSAAGSMAMGIFAGPTLGSLTAYSSVVYGNRTPVAKYTLSTSGYPAVVAPGTNQPLGDLTITESKRGNFAAGAITVDLTNSAGSQSDPATTWAVSGANAPVVTQTNAASDITWSYTVTDANTVTITVVTASTNVPATFKVSNILVNVLGAKSNGVAVTDSDLYLTAAGAGLSSTSYSLQAGKTGSSTPAVSNADVLKSIVALIASINKQIQALQKLILARR